jgi:2'-5' RNA ligase
MSDARGARSDDAPALDPTHYDRFSIVTFAPAEIRDAVDALRRQLPPSGRPIMQAHVTLKGTFVEPGDLAEIAKVIRRDCAEAAPISLTTTGVQVFGGEGGGVALSIAESEPLMALHRRLVADLRVLCRTTYSMEGASGAFHPHLTLVQQLPAAVLEEARRLAEQAAFQWTFPAREAALVGRRGGTIWETLRAFPMGTTGTIGPTGA